jgi:hypothetical protein
MNKLDVIKSLAGDEISDLVANDLRSSYELLKQDLEAISNGENRCPMYSNDPYEDYVAIKELVEALAKVHSYYSVNSIS